MRRITRLAIIVVGALLMVSGLAFAVGFRGPAPGDALSRREAFVGLLTLAVLTIALFGFDLRDWF